MEPLGTVAKVAARVGEAIATTEEVALANSMLEEASAQVRLYGLPWPTLAAAPAIAVTITVAAAARGYQNPGGLKMERGDAVTFDVDLDYRKGATLTAGEIVMLQRAANVRGRIVSVPLTNPDRFTATSDTPGYAALPESVRLHGSPW